MKGAIEGLLQVWAQGGPLVRRGQNEKRGRSKGIEFK